MYLSNQLHTHSCSWPYGYLFPLGLVFFNEVLTSGDALSEMLYCSQYYSFVIFIL